MGQDASSNPQWLADFKQGLVFEKSKTSPCCISRNTTIPSRFADTRSTTPRPWADSVALYMCAWGITFLAQAEKFSIE